MKPHSAATTLKHLNIPTAITEVKKIQKQLYNTKHILALKCLQNTLELKYLSHFKPRTVFLLVYDKRSNKTVHLFILTVLCIED